MSQSGRRGLSVTTLSQLCHDVYHLQLVCCGQIAISRRVAAAFRGFSSQIRLVLSKNGRKEGHMSHVLDSVDRQIIRVLQRDGRTSNVEIARHVGVSEATVRKRLERLLSTRMIRITAMPNASRIGFSSIAFMTLSMDLASVGQIAEEIARLPDVRTVHLTSGGSELIVEAWFMSSEELLHFMTQHIGGIAGIRKMAISHVLRTFKDGSGWILPSAPSPSNTGGR
jgi:Lrp/AsnC family transcriptional regulator for asnA, asnC and gidA